MQQDENVGARSNESNFLTIRTHWAYNNVQQEDTQLMLAANEYEVASILYYSYFERKASLAICLRNNTQHL